MQEIDFNLPVNEYLEGGVLNEEFRKIDENFNEVSQILTIKKEFVSKISQTTTEAPTLDILRNDYGLVPIPTREGVGDYDLTFAEPVLTEDNTVPVKELLIDADGNKIIMEWKSTTVYNIKTTDSSDEPTDGILADQYLSFETYR